MSRRKVVSTTEKSPPQLPNKLLTVEEVMELLGVCRTEVYNMTKRGLKYYRLGTQRGVRIAEADLALWLAERQVTS